MKDVTWAQVVAQAEHRLAIGATDVYLGREQPMESLPWAKCVGMKPGGSHRLDIATDVQFTFRDKGITGTWYYELETRGANGKSHYEVDVDGALRLLTLLPPVVAVQFRAYLAECAEAVTRSAEKYQEIATREYGSAAALRAASRGAS